MEKKWLTRSYPYLLLLFNKTGVFNKTGAKMKKQHITTTVTLFLCGIVLLQFLSSSKADVGPSTSYGGQPYKSVSGDISSSNTAIVTDPTDDGFG